MTGSFFVSDGDSGFEPELSASEADVLPLDESPAYKIIHFLDWEGALVLAEDDPQRAHRLIAHIGQTMGGCRIEDDAVPGF